MSTNNTQHSATTQQRCWSDLITGWPDPHFLLLCVWRINTNQDPFYIKTKNQTQAFSYYFPFYPSSFVSALMLLRVITFDHEIPAWPAHSPLSRCSAPTPSSEGFVLCIKKWEGRQERWGPGAGKTCHCAQQKYFRNITSIFGQDHVHCICILVYGRGNGCYTMT